MDVIASDLEAPRILANEGHVAAAADIAIGDAPGDAPEGEATAARAEELAVHDLELLDLVGHEHRAVARAAAAVKNEPIDPDVVRRGDAEEGAALGSSPQDRSSWNADDMRPRSEPKPARGIDARWQKQRCARLRRSVGSMLQCRGLVGAAAVGSKTVSKARFAGVRPTRPGDESEPEAEACQYQVAAVDRHGRAAPRAACNGAVPSPRSTASSR